MIGLLSNSRLKAARLCDRFHYYEYELGYRPADTAAPLRFGTLMHDGLEGWWRGWQLPGLERLEAALSKLTAQADPFDLVRAQELLRGYHFRWEGEPYEVISVEQKFDMALRNPATGAASRTWRLGGKLDVLLRDLRVGLKKLMEHKTSSDDIRPGSTYYQQLRMDGQVSVYFDGAAALGHDVVSCVYDVIGKPSIRPLKATPIAARKYTKAGLLYAGQRDADETLEEFRRRLREDIASDPASYYQRAEVVRLEEELQEARHEAWQVGQQIRESQLADRHPRNPDACVRFGRICPFFPVCCNEATLDDPRYVHSAVIHPELADPPEERAERAVNPQETHP